MPPVLSPPPPAPPASWCSRPLAEEGSSEAQKLLADETKALENEAELLSF